MTCKQFEKRIGQWLNGSLSGKSLLEFESHLSSCQRCSSAVAFEKRSVELMSGRAYATNAMSYRLARELDAVDAGPSWTHTWTTLGKHTMKKAIWPATAAVMAFGLYTVIAPNGALATTVTNGLKGARGAAQPNQASVLVQPTLIDGPINPDSSSPQNVFVTAGIPLDDKDLTDKEREFVSQFSISIQQQREGKNEPVTEMKVVFDQKALKSSADTLQGATVVTAEKYPGLRAVIQSERAGKSVVSIRYERLKDGKWEEFLSRKREDLTKHMVMGVTIDGIEEKLWKDLKVFGELNGKSFTESDMDFKDLEKLKDLKIDRMHFELSKEDRLELEKKLKDIKIELDGKELSLKDLQLKHLDLADKEVKKELDKLHVELKALKLKDLDGKMKDFDFEFKDMKFKEFDRDMKLHMDRLEKVMKDGQMVITLGDSGEGVGFTVKKGDKPDSRPEFTLQYDKSKFREVSGDANQTVLESIDAMRRIVISMDEHQFPAKVEVFEKKDGKWISKSVKTMRININGGSMTFNSDSV